MSTAVWLALAGLSLAMVYFSAVSVASGDASRLRLESALRRRGRGAWLERFDEHAREYSISSSAWAVATVAAFLAALLHGLNGRLGPYGVGALLLAWLLLAGLALPRAIARYSGEALLSRTLPVLELLRRASWPMLRVVDWFDEVVRRLSGMPASGQEDRTGEIEQEILDIVSEAQESGAVGPTQTRVIRSVMDLDVRTVGQIMTPRTEIVAVDVTATFEEARRSFVEGGHSRMPVYDGTIDNVLGVLYAKDLLKLVAPGATGGAIRELMRTAPFVPETKVLPELLREFQTNRVHIAIVLDEYGGTAGLVTFEDILEELVGDIADEHESPEPQSVRRIDERTAEVDARIRVDELNATLGLNLPEGDAYDTLAGLVLSRIGRIPVAGESVSCDDVQIRVLDADDRRINRLRVQATGGT